MSGGTAISSEDIVSSLQKLHNSSGRAGVGGTYAYSKYKVYKSARMVNFINAGGGDPLCTLHRAEGLYGWVRCRGYMRDSLLKT